jgi:hypothetical protein|tara:strand:- start:1412 stop:1612 length:201 start_codon:yes stop_codon:yes gene_type:complete
MTAEELREQIVPMFAIKKDVNVSMKYALDIGKAEGMPEAYMMIAVLVYANTLLEQLAKQVEDNERK